MKEKMICCCNREREIKIILCFYLVLSRFFARSFRQFEVNQDKMLLTAEQQESLNQSKAEMRFQNENFIRAHPELKNAISYFMSKGTWSGEGREGEGR